MKNRLIIILFVLLLPLSLTATTEHEDLQRISEGMPTFPPDIYARGVIIRPLDKMDPDALPASSIVEQVRVQITSGPEIGREVTAQNSITSNTVNNVRLNPSDKIVIVKSIGPTGERYYVTDFYRITPLVLMTIIFFAFVLYFGRLKGLTSLLGLALSIGVLAFFIVPQILAGKSPLMIILAGSLMIILASLYLAHGFNKRTTIALASTVITLVISVGLAIFFVSFARLLGTGREEALYLQMGTDAIDLQGLLLGGIIIGALGVLDDITTAQSAVVDELHKANPSLGFSELYHRGLSVGKEHIAALVNTLALAYAGVGLPLFLLFSINRQLPLWTIFNGQDIAEEIVRTLVGSTALVLAVPIATALASAYFSRKQLTSETL